jgi:hypothetical protein
MIDFDLDEIGYFKYKGYNNLLVDCVKEYPITEEIRDYLKNRLLEIEIETKEKEPIRINGKLVVII